MEPGRASESGARDPADDRVGAGSRAWNAAVRLRTFVKDWQQFGHVLDEFLQADEEWCVRSIARVLSDDCDPRFSDGCAPVSTP